MIDIVKIENVGEYSILASYTGNKIRLNILSFIHYEQSYMHTALVFLAACKIIECGRNVLLYFNEKIGKVFSEGDDCLLGSSGEWKHNGQSQVLLVKCISKNPDELKWRYRKEMEYK